MDELKEDSIKYKKSVRAILGLDEQPPREITKNRRGIMSYSDKTGGQIQIFNNESWQRNKRYYVPRRGCKSVMKQF